jgi:hypothetical protein
MQSKTVIPIIFDGKLWSCKRAYRYESLERTPIWEYPKIGYEIMTSVDADLRSGRRSESIKYTEPSGVITHLGVQWLISLFTKILLN